MSVTVRFKPQFGKDLKNWVPPEEWVGLILEIEQRLGSYPGIGKRMPPPDAFARNHIFGDWRVFYEPYYDDENDRYDRVNVLRVVPANRSPMTLNLH